MVVALHFVESFAKGSSDEASGSGRLAWHGWFGPAQRMVEEGDFAHIEPVIFDLERRRQGPGLRWWAKLAAPLQDASNIDALKARDRHHPPGRRLHQGSIPEAARCRLETAIGSMQLWRCAWPMTP